jgi:hypothetical protein
MDFDDVVTKVLDDLENCEKKEEYHKGGGAAGGGRHG